MARLFFSTLLFLSFVSGVSASDGKKAGASNSIKSPFFLPVSGVAILAKKSAESFAINYSLVTAGKMVTADDLPEQTKSKIVEMYPGYTIAKALKLTFASETVYLVTLEDENDLMMIEVTDQDCHAGAPCI